MSDQIIPKRPSSPIATTLLAICAVGMIGAIVLGCMELKELKVGSGTPAEKSAESFYGSTLTPSKDGSVKFKSGKLKKAQAKVLAAIEDVPTAIGGDGEEGEGEEDEG